jgi:hypothetical protein
MTRHGVVVAAGPVGIFANIRDQRTMLTAK